METTKQVKKVPNPTGKGGFQDHPELRSDGGWKKENTISYQYRRFLNMSQQEINDWVKSDERKTMAMILAYNRVKVADKSLPDMKEITDRIEGKAFQAMDVTSGGEKLEGLIIVKDKS